MKQTKNNSTEHLTLNTIYNEDCIKGLNRIPNNSVDLVLTDIPYGEVNRANSGIRNLDKGDADIVNFDLVELTQTLCNKTKGSIYMFCGFEQVSEIIKTMREEGLITRIITWEKTNPSPMNGQNLWLSASELCVFGKKRGATFNGHCMSNVLHYPTQRGKIHPTMKPVKLFEELITTSSNEGDLVLDTFMGSGTTAIACMNTNRRFVGFELNKDFYNKANERICNHRVITQNSSIEIKTHNMKQTNTILEKVANEHTYLHTICGGDFLKAIYDLFNCTEGVMDNECAKSFLQLFAEVNDIMWEDAVEYLYYIMEEAFPKFSNNNKENLDIDWVGLRSDKDSVIGKFLRIKGNEKYASKRLIELFCKRASIDIEDFLKESVMDAYGWKRVIKAVVMYVIEEYLSVEERYEDVELVESEESTAEESELSIPSPVDVETKESPILVEETESFEVTELPMVDVAITPSEESEVYGKKAVKAVCLDDGTETMFKSIGEVAKVLGIKSCTVSNFKKGKKEYCRSKITKKKYKFVFFDEDKGKILMVEPSTKEVLESYSKATDASRKWGLNYDTLQGKLKCKCPESHFLDGYEWWREKDYKEQYAAA